MVQVTRRWWLLTSLSAPFAAALSAQSVAVRMDGNFVHLYAPNPQFLTGKNVKRLKDAATVAFLGQISVSTDNNRTVQVRQAARFAMSYDIWEEMFSVTRFSLMKGEEAPRKSRHQNPDALQHWCLENLTIDVSQFSLDQQLWFRLEIRAEDNHEGASVIDEKGINLSRLVELFSRPAGAQQDHWQLDAGPVRLKDIRQDIRHS
jgi:hypothetical protein